MTSLKPFQATDLFSLNAVNLDPLTENFNIAFYLEYLTEWPSLFFKSTELDSTISGYMMAKTEGKGPEWHTHITAVTINSHYRRIGLASYLCDNLEYITDAKPHEANFIDLFVKVTNSLAISLYEKLGYSVFRRVVGYYGNDSPYPTSTSKIDDQKDAFDMRKAMKRDQGRSIRSDGRNHKVLPHEVRF
ncbi:CYFA0S01e06084g1_1 [Cyberlindnera fabianii]|uniref:CYFA0S01e06084g1_1 n=1 Tax=Cyberlindnera fabianii TaxID=36022 RepID=A0A061ANT3_CYBFA|nr:CYFA0S01e06084g1_1 [Cyberlindnera fabianii]